MNSVYRRDYIIILKRILLRNPTSNCLKVCAKLIIIYCSHSEPGN